MSHDGDERDDVRTDTASERPASQDAPIRGDSAPLAQHDPGRYRILGEHGRGGLGKVTRVHDRHLGRDIAIKELIAHSDLSERRFQREALITARLEHPGIVPVHEAGRWPDGTPFYAMKLVAGRPLRDLIAERTSVEQRLGLLHHVIAVADAIAYAHGRGIIHRDLKPANVIVGDFGETVVIDWGLAKDLRASDDLPASPSPSPDTGDRNLTSAGSILGTPAYMAPEQARGEPVDPRADVFAIGAMLWELCALAKVPPADKRVRDRLLRNNGIDGDLIAIIDKALAADRDLRYPDAAALAADLKAFKAGARIASRDYSPLGTLAHWARRHRALALAVTAAIVIAVAGAVLYVHGVTVERDRADTFNNELLLSNAEALVQTDPTAAAALLRRYSGSDRQRQSMLQIEAEARGAAILRIHPHANFSLSVFRAADGSIITYGDDHTIQKVTLDGVRAAVAASEYSIMRYAEQRNLLAYLCRPAAICLRDTLTNRLLSESVLPSSHNGTSTALTRLELSPRGSLLAAMDGRGRLVVWQLTTLSSPTVVLDTSIEPSTWLYFVDEKVIFAVSETMASLIDPVTGSTQPARIPGGVPKLRFRPSVNIDDRQHRIAIASMDGTLTLLNTEANQAAAQTHVCHGSPYAVLILHNTSGVAYTCSDGRVGLWDPQQGTATELDHFVDTIIQLAESDDGCCLYMGEIAGNIHVLDLTTKQKITRKGHTGAISNLQPPSPRFPYLLSLDTHGEVRAWSAVPLDHPEIASIAGVPHSMHWLDSTRLTVTGASDFIVWDGHHTIRALHGHRAEHSTATVDPTNSRLALFGNEEDLEIWTFDPTPTMQEIHTGRVYSAEFSPDAKSIIVATRDTALSSWNLFTGARSELVLRPELGDHIGLAAGILF